MQNAAQEQVTMEAQTPSGLTPDDVDPEMGGMPGAGGMPGMGPA
jgi:hypothetical protein